LSVLKFLLELLLKGVDLILLLKLVPLLISPSHGCEVQLTHFTHILKLLSYHSGLFFGETKLRPLNQVLDRCQLVYEKHVCVITNGVDRVKVIGESRLIQIQLLGCLLILDHMKIQNGAYNPKKVPDNLVIIIVERLILLDI